MRSLALKLSACCIFISCAYWYARSHFYRDPGSAFFDKSRAFDQRYSQYRKSEVASYIESFNGSASPDAPLKAAADSSLCVALNSVRRDHAQYLEVTVGSLLQGLTPQERADLHVAVLIAETHPNVHPSWHQEWMHEAVDDIHTYNASETEISRLARLKETGAYAEKGVYDYMHSLRRCYDTGAPYIGMFEDDILLADGWMVRTLQHLSQIPPVDDEEHPWLFMRLFNQERSTGWASHAIGGNNEAWIILGIALGLVVPAFLARRKWHFTRTYLDLETILIIALVLNPALVVLFFQSGKASLLPPFPGVFAEPFGCCSQAMIFPRTRVPLLLNFLEQARQGQIDLLLDQLAKEKGMTRWASYPVQAQHIGLESSRMTEGDEAQAIWSMAFEALDPETLSREHAQMVEEYYGRPRR